MSRGSSLACTSAADLRPRAEAPSMNPGTSSSGTAANPAREGPAWDGSVGCSAA